MLVEFSVENYLSFRDRKVLSMEATGISDYPENTFDAQYGRFKLLKGAVIYGANSSGKSNLIKAFRKMRQIVLTGRRRQSLGIIPHQLYKPAINEPSRFEAIFIIDNVRFRYGFAATNQKITAEWLYTAEKQSERMLFLREGQTIEISDEFEEGNGIEQKTSEERPFLSIVFDFNGTIATKICEWFEANTTVISGLSHAIYAYATISRIKEQDLNSQIISFYNELNLGFNKLVIETEEIEVGDEDANEIYINQAEIPKTFHPIFDNNYNPAGEAKFDLRNQESDGTNKLFNLSGAIFKAFNKGGVLIIDEFDSSVHPLIMLTITRLFNSVKTNPNNAQLIYTTHDTNMLQYGNYRRDQVWFTEKDKYGGTDLYSLVEINDKPRKGADFEEQYIRGRYGAIPYIGNIEKLFEEWHKQAK